MTIFPVSVVLRPVPPDLPRLGAGTGGGASHILPQAEFAYNNSVNRSIGMSPFEVVHGYKSIKPTDLIPLPQHARVSITAESFA